MIIEAAAIGSAYGAHASNEDCGYVPSTFSAHSSSMSRV
jgi:hypothetical protein